jgi:hypothetical protein
MPTEASALGFANRWYRRAFATAQLTPLANGTAIRVISPPVFLGTKIEAFRGRGGEDFLSSRDLEDFVSIVDARDSILSEISSESPDLRSFLAEAAQELLSESNFLDALAGYLLPDDLSQRRLPSMLRKLQAISRI